MSIKFALPTLAAIAASAALSTAAGAVTCPTTATCYTTVLTGTGPYSAGFTAAPATSGTDIYYFALPGGMTDGQVAGAAITVDFGTTVINNVVLNGNPLTVSANYDTMGNLTGYSASGSFSPRDAMYQYLAIKYTVPTGTVGRYSGVVSFTPTASPAPEAATWSMMIAGFGLVGGALRSRKAKAVFA